MTEQSKVLVTLSVELLSQLRARAASLEVPLDWFVAGLVCDTIESFGDKCLTLSASDSSPLDAFDRDYAPVYGGFQILRTN